MQDLKQRFSLCAKWALFSNPLTCDWTCGMYPRILKCACFKDAFSAQCMLLQQQHRSEAFGWYHESRARNWQHFDCAFFGWGGIATKACMFGKEGAPGFLDRLVLAKRSLTKIYGCGMHAAYVLLLVLHTCRLYMCAAYEYRHAAFEQEDTNWSCVHQDFLHMCSTHHLLVCGYVSLECSTIEFGQKMWVASVQHFCKG